MRIRQVKPAFWTDSRVADLPPAARLFYIGLWMVADDAGWLRWDVAQLGAELFSFDARGEREANVSEWGDLLEVAGRIVRHACGHAHIPTLADHQRMAAATKRVTAVEREHQACPADSRGNPRTSAAPRSKPVIPDTERKGKGKGEPSEERLNETVEVNEARLDEAVPEGPFAGTYVCTSPHRDWYRGDEVSA